MAIRNVLNRRIDAREQWGAIVFLLAGVLFSLVVIALFALGDAVADLVVELTIAVVFVLVGARLLAIQVGPAAPLSQLVTIGRLGAVVGLGGGVVVLGLLALATTGIWESGALLGAVWMVILIALALAFLAIGGAGLRAATIGRPLGGLLLLGGAALAIYVVNAVAIGIDPLGIGMMVVWAISLLGIGIVRRSDRVTAA